VGSVSPAARKGSKAPAQIGLWGRAEPLPTSTPDSPAVNDLELIEAVIRTATEPGYVLIGPSEQVYVREAGTRNDVYRAPSYEAAAVAQLLDSRHFTVGGTHTVKYGQREGPARSVLVTALARNMLDHWAALHPL
jgi:hypothetical protein